MMPKPMMNEAITPNATLEERRFKAALLVWSLTRKLTDVLFYLDQLFNKTDYMDKHRCLGVSALFQSVRNISRYLSFFHLLNCPLQLYSSRRETFGKIAKPLAFCTCSSHRTHYAVCWV